MSEKQIAELVSFGNHIEVLVTPGAEKVYIRDFEFTEFIPACLYLQQIQATEIPENFDFMVA